MKKRLYPILGVLVLSTGCGRAPESASETIVTTHSPTAAAKDEQAPPSPSAINDMIAKDERRSAEILNDALGSENPAIAGWAAVYLSMLGIIHDNMRSFASLSRAVSLEDPLLASLSWRWLAVRETELPLPKWSPGDKTDPVSQVLAALAFSTRGRVPKKLRGALGLPGASPEEPGFDTASANQRIEQLLMLSVPFDNGPLALALTFIESKRREWREPDKTGTASWVARRLRNELFNALLGNNTAARRRALSTKSSAPSEYSALSDQLETPLYSQPPRNLRAAALTGSPSLRRDSLRALAITATRPEAGDFGAAAAALKSDDQALRVEGARTFLVLVKRARRQEAKK